TEPYLWGFSDTGAFSTTNPQPPGQPVPFPDGLMAPPIRLQINTVGFGQDGFLDTASQSSVFYEAYDLVSARAGLAFDAAAGVLLSCVGEGAHRVIRLDPSTQEPVAVG